MGTTIVSTAASSVERVIAPIIEVKEKWSGGWGIRSDLEFVMARVTSAAHDLPKLECRRLYGAKVKAPHETTLAARTPIDIIGWWIRLRLTGKNGAVTCWVGRIETESRRVYGSPDAPSGEQRWVCYGADQILRKVHICDSIWLRDEEPSDSVARIGWVPGMNSRDELRMIVGNRSATKLDAVHNLPQTYVYGGTETWTRYQYAEYILKQFVEEGTGGPTWKLTGQAYILRWIFDNIAFSGSDTAAEILRKLISTRHGLDYHVTPDGDVGFNIDVFALSDKAYSAGSAILPANPATFDIKVEDEKHLAETRVVRSQEHKHGLIRVIGRRIVVCCSLLGDLIKGDDPQATASQVPKWPDELEADYKAGTGIGSDGKKEHDAARLNERYRPVYQFYGAPADWDWHQGLARVEMDGDGNIEQISSNDYQNRVRRTLTMLPLREGLDYSTDPPSGTVPDDHEADYRSPEVFIADEEDEEEDKYFTAEVLGIGVSASGTDWGVVLTVSPNHRLALEHWEDAAKTQSQPEYDHEKMVITIAIETDKRFELNHQTGDDWVAEDGVLVIQAPECEFWYLAPDTVVGVNEDGTLKKSPSEGVVLRNDADRMALIVAGAMARYAADRVKAELVYNGLRPYDYLIGQILKVVEAAGEKQKVGTPITSVEWRAAPIEGQQVSGEGGRQVTTTLKTGFAR